MPSGRRKRAPLAAAALFALIPVLAVLAPPAAGLSCARPPSDWAEVRVVGVESGRLLARVPFEGHEPGYGCNVGNLHDLHAPWLVALASPSGESADTVRVLDLGNGASATFRATNLPVEAIAVDPPHVVTVTPAGTAWRITTYTVDAATGTVQTGEALRAGDQVALHHRYVHLLTEPDDTADGRPRISVYDAVAGAFRHEDREVPIDAGGPPWRLMTGDGTWVVVASDDRKDSRTLPLHEATRMWLHRAGTGDVRELALRADEVDEERWGRLAFDGSTLYNEVWQATLPWMPGEVWRRPVAAGPGGAGNPVDLNGSLMRGIAVDQGRVVVGSYLDAPPADPTPWVSPDQDVEGPTTPGPAGALVAAGMLGAAWVWRPRNGPSG